MKPEQKAELDGLLLDAAKAAHGDSNDEEIQALNDALDMAVELLGMERPDYDPYED